MVSRYGDNLYRFVFFKNNLFQNIFSKEKLSAQKVIF